MKGKNYREFRRYGAQCDAHCRQPQHQKSRRLPHHLPFWISTSTSHPHPALYKPPPPRSGSNQWLQTRWWNHWYNAKPLDDPGTFSSPYGLNPGTGRGSLETPWLLWGGWCGETGRGWSGRWVEMGRTRAGLPPRWVGTPRCHPLELGARIQRPCGLPDGVPGLQLSPLGQLQ